MTTTIDTVRLSLPDGGQRIDDPGGGDGAEGAADTIDERRWLWPDGLSVHLAVTPAERPADLDPLALDLTVGATLDRYERHFGGRVDRLARVPIAGAVAGKAAFASMRTTVGEPVQLLLTSALAPDRRIVTVQVTWPEGVDLLATAAGIVQSLALDTAA
jgi:hypothetical protein